MMRHTRGLFTLRATLDLQKQILDVALDSNSGTLLEK